MTKQFISLLAASAITLSAVATDFTVGPFTYEVGEDPSTVVLTKATHKDESGVKYTSYEVPATVTDEGGTVYNVTVIGQEAFKWCDATKITLPDGITEFGYGAFASCSSLTELNMPSSLVTIGDYALNSTALTSIVLPSSVKTIGGSAFFTCRQLSSITLNEGLESIGVSCFYGCNALTSVNLPSTLTTLGAKAFLRCPVLESVTLSPGITELGDGTFNSCYKLQSITIPEGVKSIGDEVFLECNALTSISIPASVESIGTSLVAKTGVTSITVDPANANFTMVDGVLYSTDKRVIYAVVQKGKTSVVADDACVGIKGGAFWGSEVTDVTVPDGFLAFDDYAFCQSALANINFPSTLVMIGEQAFASTSLTSVNIPSGITMINDGAFAGCNSLQTVTLPASVQMIYNHAFLSCVNLSSMTCLGTTPPEIDDVYDDYDSPFYQVPKTVPVYVPFGCVNAYKSAGWDSYLTITESAPVLSLESANPASGTVLGKYPDMAVTLTFSEDITIANNKPAVVLRKGNETTGSTIDPDDAWYATSVSGDAKSVRIWASDYDGYTQYFSTAEDEVYYLVIPEGVVKNADGTLSEKIVIVWNGPTSQPQPEPTFNPTTTAPAQDEEILTTYADMGFRFTFDSDITILDFGPDATFTQTLDGNTTTLEPDLYWKAQKDGDNTLYIWAADYDYYLQSFNVKENATYTFTLPANVVQNADGVKNQEFVLTFTGKKATVEPAAFEPVTTAPAQDEEILTTYADMGFRFTFDSDITILDFGPDATFTQTLDGNTTTLEPDLYWKAQKDGDNTLYIWAADYDYYLQSFNVKENATYTFTLPANVVQNADGVKNQEFVLTFTGKKTSGINIINAAADAIVARYDVNGRPVGADYKGLIIIRTASGAVTKQFSK